MATDGKARCNEDAQQQGQMACFVEFFLNPVSSFRPNIFACAHAYQKRARKSILVLFVVCLSFSPLAIVDIFIRCMRDDASMVGS